MRARMAGPRVGCSAIDVASYLHFMCVFILISTPRKEQLVDLGLPYVLRLRLLRRRSHASAVRPTFVTRSSWMRLLVEWTMVFCLLRRSSTIQSRRTSVEYRHGVDKKCGGYYKSSF